MISQRRIFWRFLLRRLGHALIVLLAISALAFLLADLAPGDPFAAERLDPRLSRETVETWRARAGLDDPLAARYGRWLGGVLRGDWGFSLGYRRPVAELIGPRLAATLGLTATATAASWAFALTLGAAAARKPGGLIDRAVLVGASLVQALPELLLALLAAALAARLGLPMSGGVASLDAGDLDFWPRVMDRARHAALPVAVLALAALPALTHHVRAAVLDALASPAVLAARARGIGGWRLECGYVLLLAANPLISLFGVSFGGLISASLAVEVVLGWPGLGPLMLQAVLSRDLHVVVAGTLLAAAFLLAGNLLADLALHRLDPRMAAGEGER